MDSLSTADRDWKEFFLEDVVSINGGKRLTKADMQSGDMPFVGASEMHNGITAFTCTINESLDSNVLGVNYNGSVGSSFYHPYKAIFSDDVKRLKWKDESQNNKYTLLFLSSMIGQQKDKYAYGYKFNAQRMKRQKILLPICKDGSIDWQFMEAYMRLKEKELLKPTIDKLCKYLIDNELQGGGKILHSNWKAFNFTEVFTEIQRGKRLKKADHKIGTTPYVSSTSFNNGVDGFIGNDSGVRKFKDCISLANSGSVGSAFYHQYEFVASDHITQLKREGLDKYAYLFMIPIINRLSEKYGFNREINDERIKREKLLLPVTQNGEIDFQFMSSFMRQIETDILGTTLSVFKSRLSNNVLNINKLGGVVWKTFDFADIFIIKKGFYNKKPPCYERGTIPFIGASDSNNGFTGFTTYSVIEKSSKVGYGKNEPIEQKIYDGSAICVTNNGSVGYAYYQQHPFTCTHDVNPLYLKDRKLNRHLAMFLISCIEKQRVCFTYARKWRPKRMVKSRLLLPITAEGTPDWEFMEQYMREIETNKLIKIVEHLAS